MRYVLYAVPVSEVCTLGEALRWVLYGEYPGTEVRTPFSDADPDGPFAAEASGFLDLSEVGDALPSDEGPAALEDLKVTLAKTGRKRQRAQAAIFSKLGTGSLQAHGSLSTTFVTRGPRDETGDWENWRWDTETPNSSPIPATFWLNDGIDWEGNIARSPDGEYQYITLSTDDLLKAFPEPTGRPVSVEKRGEHLVSDLNPLKTPRSGRPVELDWRAFDVEVALYVAEHGLPSKMARLERHMSAWCIDHWPNGRGAPSSINGRISELYQAKRIRDLRDTSAT